MELDIRLKPKEILGADHLSETFDLTATEMEELKESIIATLKASSFFINWGQGERVFMVGIAWAREHE